MSKKSETPASVRVARWAAVAAAITALGTIGNTFIEKRPWFLGGEEEKPAVVERAVPVPTPRYYSSVRPSVSAGAGLSHNNRSAIAENDGLSRVAKPEAEINSIETDSAAGASPYETPQMQMMMAQSAPDLSWYEKAWNYILRHQTASWVVLGSTIFGTYWIITEFFYGRKKKRDRETQPPFDI